MNTAVETLYDTDFCAWAESVAERLRSGDLEGLDLKNIADEIGDLARKEYREVRSNLRVVLKHMLKWDYQEGERSGSWVSTIDEHRTRLRDALEASPSLNRKLQSSLSNNYGSAATQAAAETSLPRTTFPAEPPYSWREIFEREFKTL